MYLVVGPRVDERRSLVVVGGAALTLRLQSEQERARERAERLRMQEENDLVVRVQTAEVYIPPQCAFVFMHIRYEHGRLKCMLHEHFHRCTHIVLHGHLHTFVHWPPRPNCTSAPPANW